MARALVLITVFVLGLGSGYILSGRPESPSAPANATRIPSSAVVNVTSMPVRILKTGNPFDEIEVRLREWADDLSIGRLTDAQIYQAMDTIAQTYAGNFPGDWLVQQELMGRRQLLCKHLTPGQPGYCGSERRPSGGQRP
jgi:hypothetical protein